MLGSTFTAIAGRFLLTVNYDHELVNTHSVAGGKANSTAPMHVTSYRTFGGVGNSDGYSQTETYKLSGAEVKYTYWDNFIGDWSVDYPFYWEADELAYLNNNITSVYRGLPQYTFESEEIDGTDFALDAAIHVLNPLDLEGFGITAEQLRLTAEIGVDGLLGAVDGFL